MKRNNKPPTWWGKIRDAFYSILESISIEEWEEFKLLLTCLGITPIVMLVLYIIVKIITIMIKTILLIGAVMVFALEYLTILL